MPPAQAGRALLPMEAPRGSIALEMRLGVRPQARGQPPPCGGARFPLLAHRRLQRSRGPTQAAQQPTRRLGLRCNGPPLLVAPQPVRARQGPVRGRREASRPSRPWLALAGRPRRRPSLFQAARSRPDPAQTPAPAHSPSPAPAPSHPVAQAALCRAPWLPERPPRRRWRLARLALRPRLRLTQPRLLLQAPQLWTTA